MSYLKNISSFIILFIISRITDACQSDDGRFYYCSAGQTCGNYYDDCQGLPTYAIIGIISLSIMILSVCIRCCIYANSNNNSQVIRRRIIRRRPISRAVRVQVAPNGTIYATQPNSTIVPVHNIMEEEPPSYEIATSTGTPKY